MSCVDLLSFEPVDARLRPLRLHPGRPVECRQWIEQIDYKALGREVNQGLPEYMQDQVKDPAQVSSRTWSLYRDYLEVLNARVQGIRRQS